MARIHADAPVWAGIAVRYPDGRIIAVEIDHPRGQIELTTEVRDDTSGFDTFRRVIGVNRRVAVELSGPLSRGWRMGEEAAAAVEIENPTPAIGTAPRAIAS